MESAVVAVHMNGSGCWEHHTRKPCLLTMFQGHVLQRVCYQAIIPPSITCSSAVMNDDSSDARKATSRDTSSGSAIRPKGINAAAPAPCSSVAATIIGVLINPGCTELARMLYFPYSVATNLVMPRTANLLAT